MSQQGGAYFRQGDGALVVPSGAKVVVEEGGVIEIVGTNFTTILAGIPTVDPEDGVSIWLDSGALKLASTAG